MRVLRLLSGLMMLLLLVLPALGQSTQTYKPADAAALQRLTVQWGRYWNHHDMDSMGTLLRPDVDFVNVGGHWLRGRAAVVADHKQKHQGVVFKNSSWTTENVAIRYVKPDIAILHIDWGIQGDNDPDGTPRPPRHGLFTWVVSKENGQWLVLAAHNVNKREPVK